MPSRHDENTGIPRWSAPWAAGWSAMSDISRIENDPQNFRGGEGNASPRANPVRRARGIGLAVSVLTAILVATILL